MKNIVNKMEYSGAAGGGGAGDGHKLLHGVVERPGSGGGGGFVINLLPAAAAFDETRLFQQPQMVAEGRTGHVHHERKVGHAFFTMAKQPEKPQAAAVAQLVEQAGQGGKILCLGHTR